MNKNTLFSRGFTLIELLVVIAIIGILAAVVIGSLNDARSGGQDASAKQSIVNLRAQAEIFYNQNTTNPYTYTGVCSDARITPLIQAALRAVGSTVTYSATTHSAAGWFATNNANPAQRAPRCYSDSTRYVVEVPLATGNTGFWCVDNAGNSMQRATSTAAGTYTCLQ